MITLAAFDISLNSTGYAITDGRQGLLVPPEHAAAGMARMRWIRGAIVHLSDGADLSVIEGYAFSAHASHAHELGEIGGVVRIALVDRGRVYVDVPPASMKLFATGKGNASKDQVLVEAVRKLGYTGHSKDIADAKWLLEMAIAHYGGASVNATKQRGLAGVKWPTIADRGSAAVASADVGDLALEATP